MREVGALPADVAVGCYECHSLNTEAHADSLVHYGTRINVVVSPADCAAGHGTRVTVTGTQTVASQFGPVDVPRLSGRPNQGVGRIDPDGSLGSCAACHPRHGFSIGVARKPETCGQCHLEPDAPAYNVYNKHGNLYGSMGGAWASDSVPWQPGAHFKDAYLRGLPQQPAYRPRGPCDCREVS